MTGVVAGEILDRFGKCVVWWVFNIGITWRASLAVVNCDGVVVFEYGVCLGLVWFF